LSGLEKLFCLLGDKVDQRWIANQQHFIPFENCGMRILVLGGTQFVGRQIVETLVDAGHPVSVLNRGVTPDPLPASVERIRGNRDLGPAGLVSLTGRVWDLCLDVSGYTARHVRTSTELLRERVGDYVFLSAVSVYGDPPQGRVTESQTLVAPAVENVTELTQETYGRLKVTCEQIVTEQFGDRCTFLRPQIVAGPFDPYDRYTYWVRRASQPGPTLVPGDGTDFLQYIDVTDLARFVLRVCETGLTGCFNLAGPRLTWNRFVDLLGIQSPVWVPGDFLREEQLTEFELPLYRRDGGPRSSLMHVCNRKAIAEGLVLSDPAVTIERVRCGLQSQNLQPALSLTREAELLQKFRTRFANP